MGMTMTQKILAAHCGEAAVTAGQLINAQLDIVLGNDITTPVAINEFEKAGFDSVFDQHPRQHCAGPLCTQQGHQERHPVQAVPRTSPDKHDILNFLRCGRDGCRARAAARKGHRNRRATVSSVPTPTPAPTARWAPSPPALALPIWPPAWPPAWPGSRCPPPSRSS